jgi:hypothetical protein
MKDMKMVLALIITALITSVTQPSSADEECFSTPNGLSCWEFRKAEDLTTSSEIWMWPDGHKADAIKLCEVEGSIGRVKVSPDSDWLIVENGGASLGISLRLFKHESGLTYKEIKKPDITGKAIKLALRDAKPAGAELLHAYLECVAWSSNSRRILVELTGNVSAAGQRLNIEWAAVYDVPTGTFSRNLAEFNRDVLWRSK